MLLKTLKLKNFKCYSEKAYRFEAGITSIYGENGSGKSSILEAISWALFNFLPYSASSRIIRKGAKSAEVELEVFSSLDKNEYQIKRKTSGATCSVYNLTKAYLVAEGVNNVQAWVRHQLNLNINDNLSSLCRNGIATPQGNLTLDFLETPENRRKIFDGLLGLDEYKLMQNKLAESLKLLQEQTQGLQIDLARSDGLEEDIFKLENKIAQNKLIYEQKQNCRQNLEHKLNASKESFKQHKNNFEKHKNLQNSQTKLEEELTNLQSKLKKLLEAEQEKNQLDEQTTKYLEFKEKRKILNEQKIELDLQKSKIIQFEEILKFKKQDLERASFELEKLNSLKQELKLYEKDAALFKEVESQEKELHKKKIQIETELKSKTAYEDELKNLNIEIDNLNISLNLLPEKQALAAQLNAFEQELEKMRAEYHEVVSLEKEKTKEIFKIKETIYANLNLKTAQEQISQNQIQLENNRALLAELKAQTEVKQNLLPKLTSKGVCPILLEPCLNLKSKQNIQEAAQSLEDELQENIQKMTALKLENESKQKELEKLHLTEKYLLKIDEIDLKLFGRSAEVLLEKGKKLKQEVEKSQEAANFLSNLESLQKRLEQNLNKKQNLISILEQLAEKTIVIEELQKNELILLEKIQVLKPIADKVLIWQSELQKEYLISNLCKEHQKEIIALTDDLSNLQTQVQKYAQVPQTLKNLEAELEQLEPLYIRWNQLTTEIAEIPSLKEYINQCEEMQKQNAYTLQELLLQNLKDENWLLEEEKELDNLQKQTNIALGEEYAIKSNLEDAEKHYLELKAKQKEFISQKENLNKLQIKEKKISRMRTLYKELAIHLAKVYTAQIARKATNLFREVLQDFSFELNWTEDYQIIMYKNGQELPFELLSGGQQIAAAISVRLGLLQEMSNIRFAFFDEPTAHLDFDRRNQLAMQIGAIQSFDQLFVITHDESFASQANNIISVN